MKIKRGGGGVSNIEDDESCEPLCTQYIYLSLLLEHSIVGFEFSHRTAYI